MLKALIEVFTGAGDNVLDLHTNPCSATLRLETVQKAEASSLSAMAGGDLTICQASFLLSALQELRPALTCHTKQITTKCPPGSQASNTGCKQNGLVAI